MSAPLAAEDARSTAPVWRDRAGRRLRRAGPDVLAVVAALALGSATVALLERVGGFDNGSPAFILAVVAVAVLRGTGPAVATAIGVLPCLRLPVHRAAPHPPVHDPGEWLNLILLLVVGSWSVAWPGASATGRSRRPHVSARRARCSTSRFTLATERDPALALSAIARMVCDEIEADRVWMMVGEAIVADTAPARQRGAEEPGRPRHAPSTPRR